MDDVLRRNLLITGAATAAAAAVGSAVTDPGSGWYRRLVKPTFQPPAWAFPVAWSALYADIAGVSALALSRLEARGDEQGRAAYLGALGTNLALNAGWSALFFQGHRLRLSTVEAGLLALSSADLARRAGRVDPALGAALAPYAAWTAFATALTGAIARRNA